MDAILAYIERYKFAIIGTTLLHLLFFFYANFTTVQKPYKFPDPQVEMSIPLDDISIDPAILEQLDMTPTPQQSEEIYNLAADQNDNRNKSFEDYSTQEMEHFDATSAKELEKQYFQEWAATHDGNGDKKEKPVDDKNDSDKNPNKVDNSNIKSGGANAFAGEVMVSFNLSNRKAHSLPKPGYTCNSYGTVVIDVKVGGDGAVKSALVNTGLSQSADECMISRALDYAKKSRFNLVSGGGTQSGTITYKFVSK
jgi:hypothetical protein